ncbi:hypothetical protein [Streptomyces sp. NRRL F-5650]|uniref:hypothetical protein n=1 Tax=Streptomyces sp. NRRL F-5650 TaxID=1463868 RepID=UPI00131AD87D|nr:hypothetical protein [Streptomyces sp. NRRL F-5650]
MTETRDTDGADSPVSPICPYCGPQPYELLCRSCRAVAVLSPDGSGYQCPECSRHIRVEGYCGKCGVSLDPYGNVTTISGRVEDVLQVYAMVLAQGAAARLPQASVQYIVNSTVAQGTNVTQNLADAGAGELAALVRQMASRLFPDEADRTAAVQDAQQAADPQQPSAQRVSALQRLRTALTEGGTAVGAATIVALLDRVVSLLGG